LYFFAEEYPTSEADVAEQLFETIETSRGTCPKLRAAVEQAIRRDESDVRVDLDEIGYPANRLPYISIEESLTCTRMRADGFGGGATLITPDTLEWINTRQWLDERLTARGLKAIKY
jgi:hypothetical protein